MAGGMAVAVPVGRRWGGSVGATYPPPGAAAHPFCCGFADTVFATARVGGACAVVAKYPAKLLVAFAAAGCGVPRPELEAGVGVPGFVLAAAAAGVW